MFIRKLAPYLVALSLAAMLEPAPARANDASKGAVVVPPEVTDALQALAVRSKLVERLGTDALRIWVTVSGNRATLTGDVPKKVTQEMAKEVALSVKGIREVDNQVKEMTPAGAMATAKYELKDSALEIKVKTVLLEEIGKNAIDITVESTDGVVSLRGKLASSDVVKLALQRVKKVDGVKKVINLLED